MAIKMERETSVVIHFAIIPVNNAGDDDYK